MRGEVRVLSTRDYLFSLWDQGIGFELKFGVKYRGMWNDNNIRPHYFFKVTCLKDPIRIPIYHMENPLFTLPLFHASACANLRRDEAFPLANIALELSSKKLVGRNQWWQRWWRLGVVPSDRSWQFKYHKPNDKPNFRRNFALAERKPLVYCCACSDRRLAIPNSGEILHVGVFLRKVLLAWGWVAWRTIRIHVSLSSS